MNGKEVHKKYYELELELEPSLRIWENNIKLNEKTLVQRSVRSTTYYLYKINFNPYQAINDN